MILNYMNDLTQNFDFTQVSHFTASSIAKEMHISRSLASQYLNELVKEKLVMKINSRPVYFLHRQKMEELREKRITKQPLEYPSAGSTFKRPEGYFAGKLIQDAGLRGYRVGGAQVSEKHCGFVINCGNASAADVDELMKQVSAKVEEQFGVTLEPEVKRLGEF